MNHNKHAAPNPRELIAHNVAFGLWLEVKAVEHHPDGTLVTIQNDRRRLIRNQRALDRAYAKVRDYPAINVPAVVDY